MSTLQGLFYYSKFSMEFISNSQIWNCGCYALTVICSLVSKLFDCSMNNKTVVVISIYILLINQRLYFKSYLILSFLKDSCPIIALPCPVSQCNWDLFILLYLDSSKFLHGFVKVTTNWIVYVVTFGFAKVVTFTFHSFLKFPLLLLNVWVVISAGFGQSEQILS